MTLIHARVGLQQRVLPEYRAPFFESLAAASLQGLGVFAGQPRTSEAIQTTSNLNLAYFTKSSNLHLFRGRAYMCWQLGLLNWLQNWQPDVLIVEANPRNLSTPSAIRWMHKRAKPVIGWGLGADSANPLETILRTRFLRSLDAIIAYSQKGSEQYIQSGVNPAKVFVAANAVTSRPVDPPAHRPANFIAGKANLLFIGRLQSRKRIDTLLHACAALPEPIQPRLIIIGDGPERFNLEKLSWEIYPKAEFTGAKHGAELEPWFEAADLFVLPGTGGLAVQQAMAHALPVMVGQADGTQGELVRPENGWVLADTQIETLSKTIQQAIADVPRLRRMGLASYRIVSEEVNLEGMVATFGQAIKSVLQFNNGPSK